MATMAVPFSVKACISIAVAILIAWIIHRWVERPAQRLARHLMTLLEGRAVSPRGDGQHL
jgi:peptidoglycan/LPS O-acetylase OafA/YrhL